MAEPTIDSGVEHGVLLSSFAEAIVTGDADALARSRHLLVEAMGAAAMVDAAGVASNFERMVRIADSTGIGLGDVMARNTADVREVLGLRGRPGGA